MLGYYRALPTGANDDRRAVSRKRSFRGPGQLSQCGSAEGSKFSFDIFRRGYFATVGFIDANLHLATKPLLIFLVDPNFGCGLFHCSLSIDWFEVRGEVAEEGGFVG